MITVEFDVEPGYSTKEHLDFSKTIMPWLNFLVENALDIEIERHHDSHLFLDRVRYFFYLKDRDETFYRLKYSSN